MPKDTFIATYVPGLSAGTLTMRFVFSSARRQVVGGVTEDIKTDKNQDKRCHIVSIPGQKTTEFTMI
jgi:hypothetical protein